MRHHTVLKGQMGERLNVSHDNITSQLHSYADAVQLVNKIVNAAASEDMGLRGRMAAQLRNKLGLVDAEGKPSLDWLSGSQTKQEAVKIGVRRIQNNEVISRGFYLFDMTFTRTKHCGFWGGYLSVELDLQIVSAMWSTDDQLRVIARLEAHLSNLNRLVK